MHEALDPRLQQAIEAIARSPSREGVAAIVTLLARMPDLDDTTAREVLAYGAERVMQALATRATITLDSARMERLFRTLPVAVRRGFAITLANGPGLIGTCPRCERVLEMRRDSDGRTYSYDYRCRECAWEGSHMTDEPTFAMTLEEVKRRDRKERIAAWIEARALHGNGHGATHCWPTLGVLYDEGMSMPTYLSRGRSGYASMWGARETGVTVDHVVLDAATFLAIGDALLRESPIRCMTLTFVDKLANAVLGSELVRRLEGLALMYEETGAVEALLAAPALPKLRHLEVRPYGINADQLIALAQAPALAALDCFHAYDKGLTDDPYNDWVRFEVLTDDGRRVIEHAERTSCRWLQSFLAPVRERIA